MQTSLLIASIIVVASAQETITVTRCSDSLCQWGCDTTPVNHDQCIQNGEGYASFDCERGPAVCVRADVFADDQCQYKQGSLNSVCNSCQLGYQLICGGFNGGVLWSQNCSDSECQHCDGVVTVPQGACTLVPSLGYVYINSIDDCQAVLWRNYSASTQPCLGKENGIYFENGQCLDGMRLSCQQTNEKFTQAQCSDKQCKDNCTTASFPTNTCVPVTGGGSAIIECLVGKVQEHFYSTSNCTGDFRTVIERTNVCYAGTGGYFENFCTPDTEIVSLEHQRRAVQQHPTLRQRRV